MPEVIPRIDGAIITVKKTALNRENPAVESPDVKAKTMNTNQDTLSAIVIRAVMIVVLE